MLNTQAIRKVLPSQTLAGGLQEVQCSVVEQGVLAAQNHFQHKFAAQVGQQ